MKSLKPRAAGRQRRRQEVAAIVERLEIPYVLEAVARRLGLRNGWLEVRLRDGFVQHAIRAQVVGIDKLDPPEERCEARTQAIEKSLRRAERLLNRAVELKFDRDELRSLVATHEYTAADLASANPTPRPQRTQKRRVES